MIKVKIGEHNVNYPTSHEEMTYGQVLKLLEWKGDMIELVSFLSGVDVDYIRSAKVIIGLDELIVASAFVNKTFAFQDDYPKCGPYTVPKNKEGKWDIRFESFGQFEDLRAEFIKLPEQATFTEHVRKYGRYVAIYLQKLRDGEYDALKVPELETEILNYPAGEVITLGSFFFLKALSWSTGTPLTSLLTTPNPKKSKRALTKSKRNSVHTSRSARSRKR